MAPIKKTKPTPRKNGDILKYFRFIPKENSAPVSPPDTDSRKSYIQLDSSRTTKKVPIVAIVEACLEASNSDNSKERQHECETRKAEDYTALKDQLQTEQQQRHQQAFEAAYALEKEYGNEVQCAGANLRERIRNNKATPLGPTRGEWTLYSTQLLRAHYAARPDLWTERISKTWCAGTLQLGYLRENGTSVGAICSLTVLADGGHFNIKFPYKTPYRASLEEQFNNGFHERYDVQDIRPTFLGGVYLRMSIPAAALGGAAEDGNVLLFGILDRTEEMVG